MDFGRIFFDLFLKASDLRRYFKDISWPGTSLWNKSGGQSQSGTGRKKFQKIIFSTETAVTWGQPAPRVHAEFRIHACMIWILNSDWMRAPIFMDACARAGSLPFLWDRASALTAERAPCGQNWCAHRVPERILGLGMARRASLGAKNFLSLRLWETHSMLRSYYHTS